MIFSTHKTRKRELEELSHGQPETIIIGTGTNGAAHVAPEAESWAREKNLDLLVQSSCDAVVKLNKLGTQKKIATLNHITC